VSRAIVAEPRLIIADEPTSELDAASRDLVFGLLRAAAENGATVVLSTHDPDLVNNCDDVVSLESGRVVE
jgi:putative ABC transport system ATP-binding protein